MEMNNNPFSLAGKTILVTGASSGIGRETAIACSRMGATVVITARNAERLQETKNSLHRDGQEHKQLTADLTLTDEVTRLVASLPPLDGAVLCAGNSTTLPLQFGTREKFDNMFDVNFFAPVELLRLLYKKKLLVKGASVVLLASIGGTHSFMPGNGVYGASKAALNSLMKYAAREYASRKIRVNSICPGNFLDGPLWSDPVKGLYVQYLNAGKVPGAKTVDDVKEYYLSKVPMHKGCNPLDVTRAILYAIEQTGETGQAIPVTGGQVMLA